MYTVSVNPAIEICTFTKEHRFTSTALMITQDTGDGIPFVLTERGMEPLYYELD
ncbi:MAG: hypothetical protein ACQEXX_06355 [Bacillota bacterium]